MTRLLWRDFLPFPGETPCLAFLWAHDLPLFPRLLRQSQFHRRARSLSRRVEERRQHWTQELGATCASLYVRDTQPLPVVGYRRDKSRRDFTATADYGVCARRPLKVLWLPTGSRCPWEDVLVAHDLGVGREPQGFRLPPSHRHPPGSYPTPQRRETRLDGQFLAGAPGREGIPIVIEACPHWACAQAGLARATVAGAPEALFVDTAVRGTATLHPIHPVIRLNMSQTTSDDTAQMTRNRLSHLEQIYTQWYRRGVHTGLEPRDPRVGPDSVWLWNGTVAPNTDISPSISTWGENLWVTRNPVPKRPVGASSSNPLRKRSPVPEEYRMVLYGMLPTCHPAR